MNYYLDTEFLEGRQRKRFFGIPYGWTKPTIDLISIGIVGDTLCNIYEELDHSSGIHSKNCPPNELYLISKDFNLKEAWNRFQWERKAVSDGIPGAYKDYWIRNNVLKPIWEELANRYIHENPFPDEHHSFSYQSLKLLIKKYGKTNKEIAEAIKVFVSHKDCWKHYDTPFQHVYKCGNRTFAYSKNWLKFGGISHMIAFHKELKRIGSPVFHAYYADYDWVVFCQLFGTMNELPSGFPYYCIDLKQIMAESDEYLSHPVVMNTFKFPKQENEHNALEDARWNQQLHLYIKKAENGKDAIDLMAPSKAQNLEPDFEDPEEILS